MRDADMTREQLIGELTELRQQVEALKATEAPQEMKGSDELRSERSSLEAQIEFIGDFDIVEASGVDMSDGGICFDMSGALRFDMKVTTSDWEQIQRANLAWMKRLESGYRFCFEYFPTSQVQDS